MAQYIDKDALVAELNKRISDYLSDSENTKGYLKKEFSQWWKSERAKDYNVDILYERYPNVSMKLAKHFFELGLKAQKGLALEAPEEMYDEKMEKDNPEQIPDTIEAAIAMLDTLVNDEDKEYILDNGSISVHHSLGRWIRNNWGLWEGGELKECLRAKGIEHPDDMSDYIIQRFIDHLKKKQTNDTGRNE